jgi:hypothetical protein
MLKASKDISGKKQKNSFIFMALDQSPAQN